VGVEAILTTGLDRELEAGGLESHGVDASAEGADSPVAFDDRTVK
jgi:hypothetical protein